jgi:hypothetical protein
MNPSKNTENNLQIGWAATDITPEKKVLVCGQFHARVSEGVLDPVTATALAIESIQDGKTADYAVMVSCDLATIPDGLIKAVRASLKKILPEIDPLRVFLNATHTHAGPEIRTESDGAQMGGGTMPARMGVELKVMNPADYAASAGEGIAEAVAKAWKNRAPGAIGFGLGHAVVGHNRRISYYTGETRMYGNTHDPDFSHVEGYEDHDLNLLCTWNEQGKLTGLIVNLACPAQVSENIFQISADYWHETREELRRRLGKNIFILPQNSASGDQSPHPLLQKRAEARMLYLKGLVPAVAEKLDSNLGAPEALRKEIAERIADAVTKILPFVEKEKDACPVFAHRVELVELARRLLTKEDVKQALAEAVQWREKYETLLREIETHPEKKEKQRWYTELTAAYRRMTWNENVAKLHKLQQSQPKLPVEIHVLRLGDVAFATNPFEYYLDFGMQIKSRSPAVQTFLIQHVGAGTYLPTQRAISGKSYGAIPASTPVGPEGGRELVDWTVAAINALWTG